MKQSEKISMMIKRANKNLTSFHAHLKKVVGTDVAISYQTLYRATKGLHKTEDATIWQIAQALNIAPSDLKDNEGRADQPSEGLFHGAGVEINALKTKFDFFVGMCTLSPMSLTTLFQDPPEMSKKGQFVKMVYVLEGAVICILNSGSREEQHIPLKKGGYYSFYSTLPHRFENPLNRKSSFLLIQDPKYS